MKVLIVAKTRRGIGACIGGITATGRSVRLIAADAATNERAGLEYAVGEVWEIDVAPDLHVIAPHVENVIVLNARRLRVSDKVEETILRFMPPLVGGVEGLFNGLVQATGTGGLYVADRTGLPERSTMFWRPDLPLQLDCEGKRIRYRYPTPGGGRALTFVGFQEPVPEIPAGTLLRVSLAHPWRPKESPGEELRCFVQLSGWFMRSEGALGKERCDRGVVAASGSLAALDSSTGPGLPKAASEVLKETFGFSTFLPLQAEIVSRVLHGHDSLLVMPTGGGKSLCYQLPALLMNGLTVVISPLIALMQDQVRQLHELEVPAACLNHMVPFHEWTDIAAQVRCGAIKILYLAPETLLRPETLLLIESSNLLCLAVDEAHCISEWGHDFRPEYRQLHTVRQRFRRAVCLALTATATTRVREDICRLLDIPPGGDFVASFNRQNLFLSVEPRHDVLRQILAFLKQRRGESGIVYCGSRKQVDELCVALEANGWPALPYHAGLPDEVRRRNQERFIRDDVPLMVATVAFGMGINKSNVRFVIHAHLPKDLESYYQEIGRAGRDGLPADCLLLYSRGDSVVQRRFIDQGAASQRGGRQARLNALMRFAEVRDCRRVPLLAYFGETFTPPCGQCDNCAHKPATGETANATEAARKFLSCVQATGQVFGAAHIIAVLRGSAAARVLDRRHDRLPIYGAGKDQSAEAWRELARRFVELGVVEQELEFGGLRLTPAGSEVLDGKREVLVPVTASSAGDLVRPAQPGPADPGLFEDLRQLRKALADEAGMPAYIIFSDRALVEMATALPRDERQFLAISGVGQAKLANYGEPFLRVIRQYCAAHGLGKAADGPAGNQSPAPVVRPVTRRRSDEVAECFKAGQDIDEIASRYQVTSQTILAHLDRFCQEGGRLDPARLLDICRLTESERAKAVDAFKQVGLERLKPVYDQLAGAISYRELQLLRLFLRNRGESAELF